VASSVEGRAVTNLSPDIVGSIVDSSVQVKSAQARSAQRAAAEMAFTKTRLPGIDVIQDRAAIAVVNEAAAAAGRRGRFIYGSSAYNATRGEAYLAELVPADQDVFDQLPRPTKNLTYDPFYVRVVFLNTLTCYNMSIIVPAMVHDQYGHFAR